MEWDITNSEIMLGTKAIIIGYIIFFIIGILSVKN